MSDLRTGMLETNVKTRAPAEKMQAACTECGLKIESRRTNP